MNEPSSIPVFDFAQVLPPLGFHFPARMTVLPLKDGGLALVSPVPIDEAMAARIAALGEVRFLIAPCLLHHMYLADALRRYPAARVVAPRGLKHKQPALRIDFALEEALPEELSSAVDVVPIEGAPKLDEFAFFHKATRTLVLTDLVFNIEQPKGWFAHLVLMAVGVHKRLGTSRALRLWFSDRARAARSVESMLALPFETLVMAHGEVVRENARARLAEALSWLSPARRALPAAT
jgi:hypothetical protein